MKLLSAPGLWFSFLIFWAVTLYMLSSFSKTMPDGGAEIPHIDKILHFGYFMGGGIIFGTWVLLWKGTAAGALARIAIPLAILACGGALDEYHQTFTPGRSGNDPFDWLADSLGSATGLLIANLIHPVFLKFSSTVTDFPKK